MTSFTADAPLLMKKRGAEAPSRARIVATTRKGRQQGAGGTIFRSVQVDLRESWWIGEIEIPTRLVLAPMAGVSVQAFRRQGRRYGAGLVCSEMVSCAGLQHRSEEHTSALQ